MILKHTKITGFLLILLALFFLFCSEKSESGPELSPKVKVALLISRTLQQTVTLVPAKSLTKEFFRKHYIPKELQEEFVRSYLLLKRRYSETIDEPSYRSEIIHFLLIKHLYRDLDSTVYFDKVDNLAIAKNPLFMAFSMIMEDMPNLSNIGNELYIEQLAKSFGVTEGEIIEGVWYYLLNPEIEIGRSVALMLDENVYTEDSFKPTFYFQNIMLPFLTYTSMGLVLRASIEEAIFNRFRETFDTSGKDPLGDALYEFTMAFRKYLLGGSLHVRYQNNLNTMLLKHGLNIFVRKLACLGYEVLDYKIPVQRSGVGDVVFLNKISVSLSMNFLGLSMLDEKNVILTMDNFLEYTDNILYTVEKKQHHFSYTRRRIKNNWTDLNTGFSLEKADEIYVKLMTMEFEGLTKGQIVNRIIRETAVHEVKHKWDEASGNATGWYNVDDETSAHISAILFGNIPYYSLVAFINRCQRFYANIKIKEVQEKMKPIIVNCWNIASQASKEKISKEKVKEELRKIYDEYRIFEDNSPLPDMDRFEKEVIESCFGSLPEFDISKISY
jgi:hypothetical protein